jgi:RNA polymerase sigma factor (TIGR02999 family)
MSDEITKILQSLSKGDSEAPEKLMPLVYDELRRLASSYMRRERSDHTLQATALVHEAYLRLVDQTQIDWRGRAHFFSIAARLMRQILVDHARERNAEKRGAGVTKLALDKALSFAYETDFDLIALDDALKRLAALDSEQSRIVELRFFGGLTIEETVEVLKLSPATIKREWGLAKAWLRREVIGEWHN